uniref:Gb3_synth domain-containing protein n=1 Tax=Macrostomum lignano TaxID=282301 RepID=A0A1I8HNH5_9PLAT
TTVALPAFTVALPAFTVALPSIHSGALPAFTVARYQHSQWRATSIHSGALPAFTVAALPAFTVARYQHSQWRATAFTVRATSIHSAALPAFTVARYQHSQWRATSIHSGPTSIHSSAASIHSGANSIHSGATSIHSGTLPVFTVVRYQHSQWRATSIHSGALPAFTVALPAFTVALPAFTVAQHSQWRYQHSQWHATSIYSDFFGSSLNTGCLELEWPASNAFFTSTTDSRFFACICFFTGGSDFTNLKKDVRIRSNKAASPTVPKLHFNQSQRQFMKRIGGCLARSDRRGAAVLAGGSAAGAAGAAVPAPVVGAESTSGSNRSLGCAGCGVRISRCWFHLAAEWLLDGSRCWVDLGLVYSAGAASYRTAEGRWVPRLQVRRQVADLRDSGRLPAKVDSEAQLLHQVSTDDVVAAWRNEEPVLHRLVAVAHLQLVHHQADSGPVRSEFQRRPDLPVATRHCVDCDHLVRGIDSSLLAATATPEASHVLPLAGQGVVGPWSRPQRVQAPPGLAVLPAGAGRCLPFAATFWPLGCRIDWTAAVLEVDGAIALASLEASSMETAMLSAFARLRSSTFSVSSLSRILGAATKVLTSSPGSCWRWRKRYLATITLGFSPKIFSSSALVAANGISSADLLGGTLQIGDEIGAFLLLLEAGEHHLCAGMLCCPHGPMQPEAKAVHQELAFCMRLQFHIQRKNGSLTAVEPSNSSGGSSSDCGPIPRILHYTFSSEHAYSNYKGFVSDCLALNPDWQVYLWRDADAERLIKDHYPDFAAKFASYRGDLQKSDAIRYAVLHRFGGVYLDMDVKCLQPLFPRLKSYAAFVDRERWEQSINLFGMPLLLMNSAMGSAPGHPFFKYVLEKLKNMHGHIPLWTTGPKALTGIYYNWLSSQQAKQASAVKVLPSQVFSGSVDQSNPGLWSPCKKYPPEFGSRTPSETERHKLAAELSGFDIDRPDTHRGRDLRRMACASLALTNWRHSLHDNRTVGLHMYLHLGYGFGASRRGPKAAHHAKYTWVTSPGPGAAHHAKYTRVTLLAPELLTMPNTPGAAHHVKYTWVTSPGPGAAHHAKYTRVTLLASELLTMPNTPGAAHHVKYTWVTSPGPGAAHHAKYTRVTLLAPELLTMPNTPGAAHHAKYTWVTSPGPGAAHHAKYTRVTLLAPELLTMPNTPGLIVSQNVAVNRIVQVQAGGEHNVPLDQLAGRLEFLAQLIGSDDSGGVAGVLQQFQSTHLAHSYTTRMRAGRTLSGSRSGTRPSWNSHCSAWAELAVSITRSRASRSGSGSSRSMSVTGSRPPPPPRPSCLADAAELDVDGGGGGLACCRRASQTKQENREARWAGSSWSNARTWSFWLTNSILRSTCQSEICKIAVLSGIETCLTPQSLAEVGAEAGTGEALVGEEAPSAFGQPREQLRLLYIQLPSQTAHLVNLFKSHPVNRIEQRGGGGGGVSRPQQVSQLLGHLADGLAGRRVGKSGQFSPFKIVQHRSDAGLAAQRVGLWQTAARGANDVAVADCAVGGGGDDGSGPSVSRRMRLPSSCSSTPTRRVPGSPGQGRMTMSWPGRGLQSGAMGYLFAQPLVLQQAGQIGIHSRTAAGSAGRQAGLSDVGLKLDKLALPVPGHGLAAVLGEAATKNFFNAQRPTAQQVEYHGVGDAKFRLELSGLAQCHVLQGAGVWHFGFAHHNNCASGVQASAARPAGHLSVLARQQRAPLPAIMLHHIKSPGSQVTWKSSHLEVKSPEIKSPGSQVTWKSSYLEVKSPEIKSPGSQVTWKSSYLEVKLPGSQVTWKSSYLEVKLPGSEVTWKSSHLEVKSPGSQVTWKSSHLEVVLKGNRPLACANHVDVAALDGADPVSKLLSVGHRSAEQNDGHVLGQQDEHLLPHYASFSVVYANILSCETLPKVVKLLIGQRLNRRCVNNSGLAAQRLRYGVLSHHCFARRGVRGHEYIVVLLQVANRVLLKRIQCETPESAICRSWLSRLLLPAPLADAIGSLPSGVEHRPGVVGRCPGRRSGFGRGFIRSERHGADRRLGDAGSGAAARPISGQAAAAKVPTDEQLRAAFARGRLTEQQGGTGRLAPFEGQMRRRTVAFVQAGQIGPVTARSHQAPECLPSGAAVSVSVSVQAERHVASAAGPSEKAAAPLATGLVTRFRIVIVESHASCCLEQEHLLLQLVDSVAPLSPAPVQLSLGRFNRGARLQLFGLQFFCRQAQIPRCRLSRPALVSLGGALLLQRLASGSQQLGHFAADGQLLVQALALTLVNLVAEQRGRRRRLLLERRL